MKPKAVQQLAKNTSLTSLSINRLEGDGDVMLPKNLTILKIDGFEIKEQVFSCLKTLSQLSSVSINSYWNQNTATLDVSPWLKDIIDRVMRLEINGIYSVDRNAIISIAKANNQCTNVYINKDPSGQERIRLDIKKEGHASFLFDLPFDELDAAIDIVHTKLKQGKGINLSIQENSLVINENILPGLSISLGKLVEKKIILNEILSKLPNDVELSLNLYDADRMLINHEFLQTFFNKHWHALDIFGTFDIDDAAFLHLNMNASLIDFSLNWESDHGYGNTRSHLGIRNMKNSKDRKHSSARFLSHTKDKIISGKMVIDIASAIPNLEITVSGENRFSSEDIIVLANNYGFHRIELDLRDVKTLGKALGYFRQIFISAQNKNPYIFLENYTADAKPRVALGANAATPDTIAALCMMPHLEALHLGETMLTTPMFQALKKCSALHTLTVRTIDSGVINFSDLPNLKILEVADWNAHIEKALSNVFGMQEIRFQATGDSSGFIPWARAKHAAATSLLSMMGNPKDGFIIKGLAVGKIPQELIRVLDQDLEARASANDRGGQDSDMPKQEYSLAFIDTDITDDVLSKLQYFPGLISLDLRGSSRISISGIASIMNNKTLRELLLPKSFQNQADLLKIENSNLAVSFVD